MLHDGDEKSPGDTSYLKRENSFSASALCKKEDEKLKIFVSYSHKDKQYLVRLQKQLYNLTHSLELIECWDDREIIPSTEWDDEIQKKMDSADLFLFLISQDFVSSDYVMKKEVPYARQRYNSGRARIISILVRSVNWELLPDLNEFQALPDGAIPVTDPIWTSEDEAWKNVELGLTKFIINEHKGTESNSHSILCLAKCMETISNQAYGPPSSSSSVTDSLLYMGNSSAASAITFDSNTLDYTKFESISKFYRTPPKQGDLISITCTMSSYGPLVIGSPFKKRKAHLRFRKGLSGDELSDDSDADSDSCTIPSDEESEATTNDEEEEEEDESGEEDEDEEKEAKTDCMLAFTAGQMVWRMADNSLNLNFLGLYQSIVRNSIPLFVDKDYYHQVVNKMFVEHSTNTVEAKVVGKVIVLPDDFTELFKVDQETKSSTLMNTTDVKPKIRGTRHQDTQPPLAIAVAGPDDGTSISYHGKSYYLDGDIWVAIEDGKTKKTSIISRFCNVADEQDVKELEGDLQKEIDKLDSYKVVFQYDQVNKPFHDKKKKTKKNSKKKKSKTKTKK